jgi:hypothetical protein
MSQKLPNPPPSYPRAHPVDSAGWISLEEAAWLRLALHGIDAAKFCEVLGIEAFDQLQREHTNRAVLLIELIHEGVSK